jgi:hypothetical protein
MITEITRLLQEEINKSLQTGFIRAEYFNSHTYNKQSEVHSRILGLIVKVLHMKALDVEIERAFNYTAEGKKYRFKPDIIAYRKGEIEYFIEYESTNSSDARFYDYERKTSDLRCIEYFGSNDSPNIPRNWVVILTLPRVKVEKRTWNSWEYKKSDSDYKKLIESPYEFYFPNCVKHAAEVYKRRRIGSGLHLLNINQGELKLEKSFMGEGISI